MKKTLLFIISAVSFGAAAQDHFSGISTSRRVGIVNANLNPAELTNLKNNYEVNVFNLSVNLSNNKLTFGDLIGGDEDFEDMIFAGNEPVNMRADVEILGPAFAFKMDKWAFAVSSAAKIRANIVDVDVNLGNALSKTNIDLVTGTALINAGYNQRLSATSWGEIGLSAARELYNSEEHSISGGITFKLLFPGSFANAGADKFNGTISLQEDGELILDDASANLNFAYSGSLAEGFDDSSNFTGFFAGGLNGFATDIGVNYRWKDIDSVSSTGYRLNAGLSLKNMGSMKFTDDNNVSNSYVLTVPDMPNGSGLNLTEIQDAETFAEVEQILLESGYATLNNSNRDFKVKLPAVLAAYADVRLHRKWYATAFVQQKLNEDNSNDQIAVQNIVSLTPRYSTGFFEAYVPLSHNEIAGFTAGIGFRLGGFFIGSGSLLSAAVNDTNQADFYTGFRFGF